MLEKDITIKVTVPADSEGKVSIVPEGEVEFNVLTVTYTLLTAGAAMLASMPEDQANAIIKEVFGA